MTHDPEQFAAMVVEAYRKTGLKPTTRSFFRRVGSECHACAAGVLCEVIKPGSITKDYKNVGGNCLAEYLLQESRAFISGLTLGFDGGMHEYPENTEEAAGCLCGQAAARAVGLQ